MKIVKFKDGTFAVRKGLWYYEFLEKDTCVFISSIEPWCKVNSVEAARELMACYKVKKEPVDNGTPIYEETGKK